MGIKIYQKGFNYSQDGPGNRLVYHMQGCNFRCPWCSNPESMSLTNSYLTCKEYSLQELIAEVQKSWMMFFDGGGVTFTGGEPTMQFDALKQALQALKEIGVHTAIETNGSHPKLPELFPLIDFLIIDFKQADNEKHKQVIGMGNETTKANIAAAMEQRDQVLIRFPLIGGFNASKEDIEQFVAFFADKKTANASFELLSYHEYGKEKWEKCGLDYQIEDAFVSDEAYAVYQQMFRGAGLKIIRT